MKKKLFGIVLLLITLTMATLGWVGYRLFTSGFSAKTEPHMIEVWMARRIRHLAIPISERDKPNPVAFTPEVLQDGLAHFADHCASCHANNGSGDTVIGKNVYPKAPDLREPATQEMSDGELFWVIHNGIRFTAMPAWGDSPPDEDLDSWKLVHFIRYLPKLTPDQLIKMKSLNPKSAHELEEEALFDRFLEGDDTAATAADGHHH